MVTKGIGFEADEVDVVDIQVDQFGKLWVNVNGVCVVRIGYCKSVSMDDPVRGYDIVFGGDNPIKEVKS